MVGGVKGTVKCVAGFDIKGCWDVVTDKYEGVCKDSVFLDKLFIDVIASQRNIQNILKSVNQKISPQLGFGLEFGTYFRDSDSIVTDAAILEILE